MPAHPNWVSSETAGVQNAAARALGLLLFFCLGLSCWHFLEFTVPLLNVLFVAAVLSIPFFALKPIRRLPSWRRWVGGLIVTPVVCLVVGFSLFEVACFPPDLFRSAGLVNDIKIHRLGAYEVRLFSDCRGGATVACSVNVKQERQILPGLLLVRTLDSFYGASAGHIDVLGANSIRVEIPMADLPNSLGRGPLVRTYALKPFAYF